MNIFMTGASGYIGGSVALGLIWAGHKVQSLVRTEAGAESLQSFGITPLLGSLDDTALLSDAAAQADTVVNAAHADHRGAAEALIDGLNGTGKTLIHTSGSSIVGTRTEGKLTADIFDEQTPFTPSPARQARVALNADVIAASEHGLRSIIICPSLIYGKSDGPKPHSMQIPWLIALARKRQIGCHIGPGQNTWSNVHIDDLVALYLLALEKAPSGAFYFAENGEMSMRDAASAIGLMLGFGEETRAISLDEAADEWGEGPANDTMASNSRVRAKRARTELDWKPDAPDLRTEILQGCYAE